MKKGISGIYCYKNVLNNKIYIGQAENIIERKKEHTYLLSIDKDSKVFQNAWNKYNEDGFKHNIINRGENNNEENNIDS